VAAARLWNCLLGKQHTELSFYSAPQFKDLRERGRGPKEVKGRGRRNGDTEEGKVTKSRGKGEGA